MPSASGSEEKLRFAGQECLLSIFTYSSGVCSFYFTAFQNLHVRPRDLKFPQNHQLLVKMKFTQSSHASLSMREPSFCSNNSLKLMDHIIVVVYIVIQPQYFNLVTDSFRNASTDVTKTIVSYPVFEKDMQRFSVSGLRNMGYSSKRKQN